VPAEPSLLSAEKISATDRTFLSYRSDQDIVPITPADMRAALQQHYFAATPGMPAFVAGFVKLRDCLVPVVDLRLETSCADIRAMAPRLIVAAHTTRLAGEWMPLMLLVDDLDDMPAILERDHPAPPALQPVVDFTAVCRAARWTAIVRARLAHSNSPSGHKSNPPSNPQ
jgi:chemotaxis signal transduction protein